MRQTTTKKNPWPGLAPYEDPKKAISEGRDVLLFCGRESETFDVARLIDDNLCVTLYGKSGIGKSSLLNAGVFPTLRQDLYSPLSLRLGRSDGTQSFQEIITTSIEHTIQEDGGKIQTIDVVEEQPNKTSADYLWNWFARHRFINTDGKVIFPVVVLDQFEEVFRDKESSAKAEELLVQLHYLIDESHAIGDCIVDGQDYYYDFNFRFVLSIREDDLYRLEDSIDNCSLTALKQCRFRLRSLQEDGAKDAVLKPGKGLFPEDEEEQTRIARRIIDFARNKNGRINTNILSFICSQLFIEIERKGMPKIDYQLVKSFVVDNLFERFYKEATEGIPDKIKAQLEENLVTNDGRRKYIYEDAYFRLLPNGDSLLEGEKKILQRTTISSESESYGIELIHDSFCDPLLEQRGKRLSRESIRRTIFISLIIILIALLCFVFALIYSKEAIDDAKKARKEKESIENEMGKVKDKIKSYTDSLRAIVQCDIPVEQKLEALKTLTDTTAITQITTDSIAIGEAIQPSINVKLEAAPDGNKGMGINSKIEDSISNNKGQKNYYF